MKKRKREQIEKIQETIYNVPEKYFVNITSQV